VIENARATIGRFASKGVLLDTNLVLLLLIGSMDEALIGTHKRIRKYTLGDFQLLNSLLEPVVRAKRLLTTPHVATEVSNLTGDLFSDQRFVILFRRFLQLSPESYCQAATVVNLVRWERLGLTDTALCYLGRRRRLVLTDDLALAFSLEQERENVINFNHLRSFF
jgi:hypothetical protein